MRDVIPTLMPHSRSGATVQYENENGAQLALSRNMDLFSFRTLDFSRFSFRCIPGAVTYRTRWKQHRSPLFAVRIGNDRPDEPFGLLALILVLCAMLALVFGAAAGTFAARASTGFARNLRHDMYYNVQNSSARQQSAPASRSPYTTSWIPA